MPENQSNLTCVGDVYEMFLDSTGDAQAASNLVVAYYTAQVCKQLQHIRPRVSHAE